MHDAVSFWVQSWYQATRIWIPFLSRILSVGYFKVKGIVPHFFLLSTKLKISNLGRWKERVPIVNYATALNNRFLLLIREIQKSILHIFLLSCDQCDSQGITIHSDRDQNKNSPPAPPPDMTYSSSTPQSNA